MRLLRLLGIASALSAGCQVVGGYDSFEAASEVAPEPHPCDHLPSNKPALGGSMVLTKQEDGTCFWIDMTEVKVEWYRDYLSDVELPLTWEGINDTEACSWKTTPSDPENSADDYCEGTETEENPFDESKPIRCVDWCDAVSFCNWAGKSLCGALVQNVHVTETTEPETNWAAACSSGLEYPYGSDFVHAACNIALSEGDCANVVKSTCGPAPVPTRTPLHCESPQGAFDMVGNVAEWVAECGASATPEDALCQTRGGSFANTEDDAITCQTKTKREPRSARDRGLGFRCCDTRSADEISPP